MANNNVSTKNVWPYYSSSNVQKAGVKSEGEGSALGKDDFLKLMVEQLKSQNPLQPMDNTQYIAQLTQFASVEQMMNMAGEMTALRQSLGLASGMIGMDVEYTARDEATGETTIYSGQVQAVVLRDKQQFAIVDGVEVPMEAITAIGYAALTEE